MLGVSARRDDLEELFPLYGDGFHTLKPSRQATELLRDLEQHRSELRERHLHFGSARLALRADHSNGTQPSGSAKSPGCVSCGLCLYGCPYELIYSTTQTLQELKAQPSFKYLSNVVVRRIEEKNGNVNLIARSRTDRTDITLSGSAVFLAAGVLSSTQILLRSLGAYNRELRLKASEYFMLPFLRYRRPPMSFGKDFTRLLSSFWSSLTRKSARIRCTCNSIHSAISISVHSTGPSVLQAR